MTKEEYMIFHAKCCEKMIDITKRKNSDYTGGSKDPFANFEQIGSLVQVDRVVEIGFITRMSDKLSRIGSFVTKGILLVKDESVEDTLLDLANYCILFAGYLRSKRAPLDEMSVDKVLEAVDHSHDGRILEACSKPYACKIALYAGRPYCETCGARK